MNAVTLHWITDTNDTILGPCRMNGHLVAKHFVSIWTGHQGTFLGTTRSSKLLIGYRGMTVIDGLVKCHGWSQVCNSGALCDGAGRWLSAPLVWVALAWLVMAMTLLQISAWCRMWFILRCCLAISLRVTKYAQAGTVRIMWPILELTPP